MNCGARPFPCEKLTLNRIDKHRALMFGGKQEKYSAGSREVFFLDLDSLVHIMLSKIQYLSIG